MITKDFTGDYDYERGEANSEADTFLEYLNDGYYDNAEEVREAVAKLAAHWGKVLSVDGMADFVSQWNIRVPAFPMSTEGGAQ